MQRSSPGTRALLACAATVLGAARLDAQSGALDPQCAAQNRAIADACQKSVDLFDFMAPQLGTAIAGGNAALGQGGAFGRTGSFAVGLRVTAFKGALPNLQDVTLSTNGAQRSDFSTNEQYLGAPALDAAVGLLPGVQVGPVRVGALDALATATYIPEYEGDDLSVRTPGGSLKVGYGGRLGLVQETRVLPGVAVTFLRRDLPEVDIVGAVAARGGEANDTLGVRALKVKTQAWRVVAGKRFLILGVAAGVGQDRYSSGARLGASVTESVAGFPAVTVTAPDVTLAQTLTRTNVFADASINLPGLRIMGEVGRATGGRVRASYNSFDGGRTRADDPLVYFAAALRFGF